MTFFLFWIPVFNEKLNKFARFSYICIMAPPTHSRPLSRPPISRGPNLFFTATFVESGRDNGHLAPLGPGRPVLRHQSSPKQFYEKIFKQIQRGSV